MAIPAFAEALFGGLEATTKRALVGFVRYALPNGKFGPPSHQAKSESFAAYWLESTTGASTGEFSIQHGLGRAPYVAQVFLRLDSSGGMFPLLEVSRPADAQRLYFRPVAGSTNRPFLVMVE